MFRLRDAAVGQSGRKINEFLVSIVKISSLDVYYPAGFKRYLNETQASGLGDFLLLMYCSIVITGFLTRFEASLTGLGF